MNTLAETHNNLWKELKKQLKNYLVSGEQKNLHRFRTSVRHINTLFNLAYFFEREFKKKHHLEHINKMFDYAGNLRDAYIAEQLAGKYKISDGFQPDEDIKSANIEHLKKCYRNNIFHAINAKEKCNKYLRTISAEDLNSFADFILLKISKCMSVSSNEQDIHQLRKDIKEYLLINKLLGQNEGNDREGVDLKYFENLQRLIGNKHDIEKLLRKMSKIKPDKKPITAIGKISADQKQINHRILLAIKHRNKNKET